MNQIVQYKEYFNKDQIELIKGSICKGATNDELKWFLYQCARARLDPFSRQIYWIKRRDGTAFTLVSIDGLRLIAERSGEYAGQMGPEWCGADGAWMNVWLPEGPPFAARVGAMRKGATLPIWGTARLQSYAPRGKDGALYGNWLSMPDVMLAKCAEALALRKAFPQDLSGFYTGDEMQNAVPDSERELLDGTGAPDDLHKEEVKGEPTADSILEQMHKCRDHTALYAYGQANRADYLKLAAADRQKIDAAYKALMEKFADGRPRGDGP
jgi:phage recombination protein Bet